MILYSDDIDDILGRAGDLDENIYNGWVTMLGDNQYQTLIDFFTRENYCDSWGEVDYAREEVVKNLKRVLSGKDRIALIEYAFYLGQLVGRAEQLLLDKED